MEVHEVPFVGWFLWVLLCRRSNYLSNHLFCQPAFVLILILAAGPCPPAKSRVDCCQLQPTSSLKSGLPGFAGVCSPPPAVYTRGPRHVLTGIPFGPCVEHLCLFSSACRRNLWRPVKWVPASLPREWCQADAKVGHWGYTPSEKIPRPDPRVHRWTRFSGLTQPRFFPFILG